MMSVSHIAKFAASKTLLALTLFGLLAGCYATGVNEVGDANITAASYAAADSLVAQSQIPLEKGRNLLVATFVNINDLEDSSTLGRLIATQVASRLTQQGYQVVQITLRNNILVKQQGGEFVLSRAVQDISSSREAQAVVAGVYAVARDEVFVKASVIRPTDGAVLSAYDYALPIGRNTRALLYTRR
jgi:TolB-like protein